MKYLHWSLDALLISLIPSILVLEAKWSPGRNLPAQITLVPPQCLADLMFQEVSSLLEPQRWLTRLWIHLEILLHAHLLSQLLKVSSERFIYIFKLYEPKMLLLLHHRELMYTQNVEKEDIILSLWQHYLTSRSSFTCKQYRETIMFILKYTFTI